MGTTKKYWLMKSEPNAFSIDDLQNAPGQTTYWDGVRNYQARNFMRTMHEGDGVLFYHSSADPPAIVGIAQVVRTPYPDHTAFDPQDSHFDAQSSSDNPRWDMVDIRFQQRFEAPLSLESLRKQSGLRQMELLRKGSRLSVQPVRDSEWKLILQLAGISIKK